MSHSSLKYSEEPDPYQVPVFGIIFLILIGISFGHCWWVGDRVAMISIGIIGFGCFIGYWYGLWRALGSSIGAFAGCQLASPTFVYIVPTLERQLGFTVPDSTGRLLTGILVGVLATLVFWSIGRIMFRRSHYLKRCDHYAGFAFGLLNSVGFVGLMLWGLLAFEPEIKRFQQSQFAVNSDQTEQIVDTLDRTLVATKKSYIMLALQDWNPFLEVSFFRTFKQKLEVMIAEKSSPRQLDYSATTGPDSRGIEVPRLIQSMFNGDLGKIK